MCSLNYGVTPAIYIPEWFVDSNIYTLSRKNIVFNESQQVITIIIMVNCCMLYSGKNWRALKLTISAKTPLF